MYKMSQEARTICHLWIDLPQLDRNSEFLVLRLLTLYMNSHSNHVQGFHEYTSNISVNNITA